METDNSDASLHSPKISITSTQEEKLILPSQNMKTASIITLAQFYHLQE